MNTKRAICSLQCQGLVGLKTATGWWFYPVHKHIRNQEIDILCLAGFFQPRRHINDIAQKSDLAFAGATLADNHRPAMHSRAEPGHDAEFIIEKLLLAGESRDGSEG